MLLRIKNKITVFTLCKYINLNTIQNLTQNKQETTDYYIK